MDNDAAGEVSEESEQLISRQYQTQLEEIAARKNSIIHLPTGSGKTFIAIRLINRFRADLKKPWGQGGKRTFFLVNTIPLVNQQKKVIEKMCAVQNVAGFSGEDGVDIWDKSKWDAELRKYQVIVMTSQILADMLTHSYIKIEDINLLIFDECHHAVIDHPMRLVMKHFESCPVKKHPRVLGLTATLLNSNVSIHKVEDTLRELETTFHATIATVDELAEVLKYSTNPKELLKFYNSTNPTSAVTEAVGILTELQRYIMAVNLPSSTGNPDVKLEKGQTDITSDPKKIVKEVKNMVVSMITFIEELGVYGGALGILAFIILMERLKRKASSVEEERMYKFSITHSVMARAILLKSMEKESGYDKIVKHSSEKVLMLLNILKEYNPEMFNSPGVLMKVNFARKPLSGIIFTKLRFTAKVLYNILKDVKEVNPREFGFLNHDFIVGFNVNPFKRTREDYYLKKTSQKALLKFCNKELNCLISTSVIEEGVDITQCRLVLRYDPPLEYRSYIQSKGRARSADSSYVIMVNAADQFKFNKKYDAFQTTEKYIKDILIGNTDKRNAPSAREIQGLYEEDEIPPYVTSTGNRLSAVSAISLLNRYCSKLPHDQFTVITPMWIEEDRNYRRHIKIYMPIACPVKDVIEGKPQYQLKSAKRSAALNACIKLHEVGELDPITLLPRQYGTVNFDEADVRKCFLNWPWDSQENEVEGTPKPGTKKRVRKHDKVFSSYLEGSTDWNSGSQTFYLHVIKLKTAFKEPADPREKALYNLLRRDEGFGLLTPKPLPKLCDFPMFLTVGEVKISIEMNYAVIKLDVQLFELVKYFHFFIFDQVLEVAKKFIVFDGTMNSLYVVPVDGKNGDYDIDWSVMVAYRDIRPVGEPSAEERRNLQVTQETYQYHVVSPWYRGTILPARYIVSNVLEYMTPQSLFDSKADPFNTYADYYSTKYNLNVIGNQNQPLLEVRNISTRMNCLLPRAATIKAFSEKQQKLISHMEGDDKPNGFPEIFIPEFCIKYDFPGVLWYKAILLPSVLHRLTMMLVAHELRAEIAKQTNHGQTHLLKNEDWLPIEVDMQVAIKSMRSQIEDPAPINTIDRINNPIDEEARRPIKIVSMKENIYQLQKKKISKDYPWDENSEPIDIERNISTATVMDIECYDEFVSALMAPRTEIETIRSPQRQSTSAAILPPPIKYDDKISILSKKPTNRGPELRDVLAALTTIGSHDTFNLERMETLGDSFLKFAASLYLFHKFPGQNEGQLTSIKSRLIGNRNLYYAGEKVGLPGRMKIDQFGPRNDFIVPGFFAPKKIQHFIETHNLRPTFLIGLQFSQEEALSGELSEDTWSMVQKRFADSEGTVEREPEGGAQNAMQCYIKSQAVSDKSVADCVEALIGTYIVSGGILGAVKLLEWFKILPPHDNFAQLLNKKIPTVLSERKTSMEEINRVLNDCTEDVESILNYKFKDPSILLEALSHPSYIRNRFTPSYERLEFLGDAILDFLITAHIFEHCSSDLKPGELTDLRSALVNNVTFASYVVKLGLYKFMCYQFNPALDNAILTFVEHQERRNHEIVEDVLYLIAEEDCMLAEYIEVPKVLSDIFESLIGAIYLDSGGNLQKVWSVVYRIMNQEIYAFSRRIPLQPVRALYEMIHACPVFGTPRIHNPDIPKVQVPVTITKNGRQHTVYGFGGNKFQAKRAAAKLALKILGQIDGTATLTEMCS